MRRILCDRFGASVRGYTAGALYDVVTKAMSNW